MINSAAGIGGAGMSAMAGGGMQAMAGGGMQAMQGAEQAISQMSSFSNFRTQQNASRMQEAVSAQNQVAQTYAQMGAERTKTSAQNFQIQAETNTKTSEMERETYVNQRKSSDKLQGKLVQLMMS